MWGKGRVEKGPKIYFAPEFSTRNVSLQLFETGAYVSEESIASYAYEDCEGLSLLSRF